MQLPVTDWCTDGLYYFKQLKFSQYIKILDWNIELTMEEENNEKTRLPNSLSKRKNGNIPYWYILKTKLYRSTQ